ncbi:hypothetical protein HDU96_009779, partial [Phlyctochytrium bullatum]
LNRVPCADPQRKRESPVLVYVVGAAWTSNMASRASVGTTITERERGVLGRRPFYDPDADAGWVEVGRLIMGVRPAPHVEVSAEAAAESVSVMASVPSEVDPLPAGSLEGGRVVQDALPSPAQQVPFQQACSNHEIVVAEILPRGFGADTTHTLLDHASTVSRRATKRNTTKRNTTSKSAAAEPEGCACRIV